MPRTTAPPPSRRGLGFLTLLAAAAAAAAAGSGAAAQEGRAQPLLSFTVGRQRDAGGDAPGDALIETGRATYLTAMPAAEATGEAAGSGGDEPRGEPQYVWTVQGEPYTGLTVGPISFEACDEGGGIHIELVELRKVPNSNWFDSHDVGVRVDCAEGRSEL